ncbi:MAG: NAD-dependent epimerase/dehydratase family protein, partial [Endomicrobiia bacterium]|nr:NAD-dependent epimerase/dehydratase family protein [Endomicrobiia bacterium]
MEKTILVTGGAGFIGSNIVEELLMRGRAARVLDNFSTGKRSNLVFGGALAARARALLEIVEGDIRDRKD